LVISRQRGGWWDTPHAHRELWEHNKGTLNQPGAPGRLLGEDGWTEQDRMGPSKKGLAGEAIECGF
jgi:hypothetical protein